MSVGHFMENLTINTSFAITYTCHWQGFVALYWLVGNYPVVVLQINVNHTFRSNNPMQSIKVACILYCENLQHSKTLQFYVAATSCYPCSMLRLRYFLVLRMFLIMMYY